jgi:hypothetical protein
MSYLIWRRNGDPVFFRTPGLYRLAGKILRALVPFLERRGYEGCNKIFNPFTEALVDPQQLAT